MTDKVLSYYHSWRSCHDPTNLWRKSDGLIVLRKSYLPGIIEYLGEFFHVFTSKIEMGLGVENQYLYLQKADLFV